MNPGRWPPSLVMDVQVLVTHPDRVTSMAREMGHPPRIIRGPDLCDLFQARDAERLPGLVDRWESYGSAAQVLQIPPMRGPHPAQDRHDHDTSTRVTEPIRQGDPRLAPPTPGETI